MIQARFPLNGRAGELSFLAHCYFPFISEAASRVGMLLVLHISNKLLVVAIVTTSVTASPLAQLVFFVINLNVSILRANSK